MSVCAHGPLLRGLQLAPLRQMADISPRASGGTCSLRPPGNAPERQVAFAQSDRHHLFFTLDGHATTSRELRIHLIDGDGLAERFTGAIEGSVFSLASAGGALMVGMVNAREISGSLVFPDGRAHRFAAEFSAVG